MGIYQLITPALSLSYALTSAGFQTAISKLVAEYSLRKDRTRFHPLKTALSASVLLASIIGYLLYQFAGYIAISFLSEPRTEPLLRTISFCIPITAVHACINGYFYGTRNTKVPALAQLSEQCVRVGCVFVLSSASLSKGILPDIKLAAVGLVCGELVSMLISVVSLFREVRSTPSRTISSEPLRLSLWRFLGAMVIPFTMNRLVLNLLQSIESVSIPIRLRMYGYSNAEALSVYGVLTGMAMPLIFFPNALTGSVSVLLLPMISEAYAAKDEKKVKKYTMKTIHLCSLMGLACMSVFFLFGNLIGNRVFQSPLAGRFIRTLGFLCPFLYLDTTVSGILQGLGKAYQIFFMNLISLSVRLAFVFFAIPAYGINGYLHGILASQILLSIMYLVCLSGCLGFRGQIRR